MDFDIDIDAILEKINRQQAEQQALAEQQQEQLRSRLNNQQSTGIMQQQGPDLQQAAGIMSNFLPESGGTAAGGSGAASAGGAGAGGAASGAGSAVAAAAPWVGLAAVIGGHNEWARRKGLRDGEKFYGEYGLTGRALYKDKDYYAERAEKLVPGLGSEIDLAGSLSSPADLLREDNLKNIAKQALSGGVIGAALKKIF